MFDLKREDTQNNHSGAVDEADLINDNNVTIHTMQDDLNALSGIFPEKEKVIIDKKNEVIPTAGKAGSGKDKQYFNPFLENSSKNNDKMTGFSSQGNILAEGSINRKESGESVESNSRRMGPVWIAILSAAIVALFLSGGYYFWINKKVTNVAPAEGIQEAPPAEEAKVQVEEEPAPKYSTDMPNFISVNKQDWNYDFIKELILKTGKEIKESKIAEPVEFIITDENNNPMTFPEFVLASKIGLSAKLTGSLNDSFSVFIYPDLESIKLGLAVKTLDQAKVAALVKSEELKLIEGLTPLFVETPPFHKEKILFKDNNYKNVAIRYLNLDEMGFFSIDYALTEGQLFIATSKNAMLAIVDKITESSK